MHLLLIQRFDELSTKLSSVPSRVVEQTVPSTTQSCSLIGLLNACTRPPVLLRKNALQYRAHGSVDSNVAFQK